MKCIGIKSCLLEWSKSPCIQNQVDSIFLSKWALKMIFLHKFAGWTSVCFNSRIIESSRAWSVCRQCITEHNEWELPDWSCCAIIDTLKRSLHFSFWVCVLSVSHTALSVRPHSPTIARWSCQLQAVTLVHRGVCGRLIRIWRVWGY